MDKDKAKAFADKVFADMAGAMTAGMGYVGVKTGLFRAMAGKGPMRVEDVARESKLTPRYVEEWLKGMTCAKYLDYDPAAQTYCLPRRARVSARVRRHRPFHGRPVHHGAGAAADRT